MTIVLTRVMMVMALLLLGSTGTVSGQGFADRLGGTSNDNKEERLPVPNPDPRPSLPSPSKGGGLLGGLGEVAPEASEPAPSTAPERTPGHLAGLEGKTTDQIEADIKKAEATLRLLQQSDDPTARQSIDIAVTTLQRSIQIARLELQKRKREQAAKKLKEELDRLVKAEQELGALVKQVEGDIEALGREHSPLDQLDNEIATLKRQLKTLEQSDDFKTIKKNRAWFEERLAEARSRRKEKLVQNQQELEKLREERSGYLEGIAKLAEARAETTEKLNALTLPPDTVGAQPTSPPEPSETESVKPGRKAAILKQISKLERKLNQLSGQMGSDPAVGDAYNKTQARLAELKLELATINAGGVGGGSVLGSQEKHLKAISDQRKPIMAQLKDLGPKLRQINQQIMKERKDFRKNIVGARGKTLEDVKAKHVAKLKPLQDAAAKISTKIGELQRELLKTRVTDEGPTGGGG